MMDPVVETAVPLMGDLEEPLISRDEEFEDEEECLQIDDEVVNDDLHYFQMMGWVLGFVLQCVSLGTTAALALTWQHIPTFQNGSSLGEQTLSWSMFGLSNSWLLLFPVV